jgi:DUF1009 family protein
MKTKSITKLSHEKDAGINRTMRMVESVGRKVIRGKEVPQGLAAATGRSAFHTAQRGQALGKGLKAKVDVLDQIAHTSTGLGKLVGTVHSTTKGYAEPITGAAHRLARVSRMEPSTAVAGRTATMHKALKRNAPDSWMGFAKREPHSAEEAATMGSRAAGEYNALRGAAVSGTPQGGMRKRLWGN